jgi:hypothetical protein
MQKQPTFPSPDAYVDSLDGWRRKCVERLRASVVAQKPLQEAVKWGHLVYDANGPVLLIRAEPERVLFGFWRGQRLQDIEPALRPSGQYEMATLDIREGMKVNIATARRLARAALALNETLGDPRLAAKRGKKTARKSGKASPATKPKRAAAAKPKRSAARPKRPAARTSRRRKR